MTLYLLVLVPRWYGALGETTSSQSLLFPMVVCYRLPLIGSISLAVTMSRTFTLALSSCDMQHSLHGWSILAGFALCLGHFKFDLPTSVLVAGLSSVRRLLPVVSGSAHLLFIYLFLNVDFHEVYFLAVGGLYLQALWYLQAL